MNKINDMEELQQYRAIGTVEQLEWCKDASHWKELFKEKLEQYEAIGTVEECRVAVERMKPKKPIELYQWGEYWKCPTCEKYAVDNFGCKYKFCRECGTKFDWSE